MARKAIPNYLNQHDCYVAYIDILGFKELLEDPEFSRKMNNIVSRLRQRAENDDRSYKRLRYIAVSDTIILIAEEDQGFALIRKVSQIQNALLKLGFATRGAISFGRIYTSEHEILGRNLFGASYVEAYLAEKKAIYPRVIILKSAQARLEAAIDKAIEELRERRQISRDRSLFILKSGRVTYVNQFGGGAIGLRAKTERNRAAATQSFSQYKRAIFAGLKHRSMRVRDKWEWLHQEINRYW